MQDSRQDKEIQIPTIIVSVRSAVLTSVAQVTLSDAHAQLLSTFLLPKGVINCFNNHPPQSCWAGAGANVPLAKFNDFGNLFDMDRFSNAVTTRALSELRVGFPLHPLWKKRIVVQVQYVPRCFLLVESEKFRGLPVNAVSETFQSNQSCLQNVEKPRFFEEFLKGSSTPK